ncbi:hypothetical protein NUW54_g14518 [Trametes sanguinea]|uniref:Uncharacterized protein n=1 Tax=Trametes sanguinea TaxID=158606 RepID=A0ACC1MDN3_9APHY|nr:hypothetical protein NUW54_g14518 [Trametes sanguinea]
MRPYSARQRLVTARRRVAPSIGGYVWSRAAVWWREMPCAAWLVPHSNATQQRHPLLYSPKPSPLQEAAPLSHISLDFAFSTRHPTCTAIASGLLRHISAAIRASSPGREFCTAMALSEELSTISLVNEPAH